MTTPLLSHYKDLGITITANGTKLRLTGAESVITQDIKTEIRNRRVCIFSELSILSELLSRSGKGLPAPAPSGPVVIEPIRTFEPIGIPIEGRLDPLLVGWIERANNSQSLADLETCLMEFSKGSWCLVHRANMSNAYTEHAKVLIDQEQADKYHLLETLAYWVWHHG